MKYTAAASLIIMVLLLTVPPPRPTQAQIALLGVSDTEVVAGGFFYAFINVTSPGTKPIVEFKLSISTPSSWKVEPYGASGINAEGSKIDIQWDGNTAVYQGDGATTAHVAFIVHVPLQDMEVTRTISARGYLLVKEGGRLVKYAVTGSKQIRVHKWEPMVFLNLSKTEIVPPSIIIANVTVLTGPPLYPTAMRDVVIKVEDSVSGLLYNETVEYWNYRRALSARIPIKIPLDAPGGQQKVSVTVEYEVAGRRLRTYVDYPYKVIKPSSVKIEKIEVPKEVKLGQQFKLNATVINPSSFKALDVEIHVKFLGKHEVTKLGDLGPGNFSFISIPLKAEEEGNHSVVAWAAWVQEYPKELKRSNETIRVIYITAEEAPYWIIAPILLLVIVIAAVKYLTKRRGAGKS